MIKIKNIKPHTQKDIDAFWSKIIFPEDENGCWEFNRCKDKDGYPFFYFNRQTIRASRFSFMIHNPDIDISDKLMLHSCHNPGCVNPKHLRPGTHQDNMNDKMEAGRQPIGKNVASAKHNEDEITLLLETILTTNFKNVHELLEKFKITKTLFWNIIKGKLWTHVTKDYDLLKIREIIFSKNQVHSRSDIINMLNFILTNNFKNTNEVIVKFNYSKPQFWKIINGGSLTDITSNFDMIKIKNILFSKDTNHKHFEPKDIEDIRRRHNNFESILSIGKLYNVSATTIDYIIKYKTYKNV